MKRRVTRPIEMQFACSVKTVQQALNPNQLNLRYRSQVTSVMFLLLLNSTITKLLTLLPSNQDLDQRMEIQQSKFGVRTLSTSVKIQHAQSVQNLAKLLFIPQITSLAKLHLRMLLKLVCLFQYL